MPGSPTPPDITPEEEAVLQATLAIFKDRYPYILDIMDEVKKVPNGLVNLQLRVYNGFVTDTLFTDIIKKTYKPPKA